MASYFVYNFGWKYSEMDFSSIEVAYHPTFNLILDENAPKWIVLQ